MLPRSSSGCEEEAETVRESSFENMFFKGCVMGHKERVTSHKSHVTRHTSHHTSHLTPHTSHVTRHTSHVTRHLKHWKINHPKYMPGSLVKVETFRAAAPALLQRMLEHCGAQLA